MARDEKIFKVIRWGKNGRKYVWNNPTEQEIKDLIAKYGCDQICEGVLWLET